MGKPSLRSEHLKKIDSPVPAFRKLTGEIVYIENGGGKNGLGLLGNSEFNISQ